MENACMKTLPNTKPLRPRWRMPWSLPCPITSSPRNRSHSPLCGSNWPHSPSPKPCPPGPRGPPGAPRWCGPNGYHNNINRGRLPSQMLRLPKVDPTTAPPDKPTTGLPNYQPPTTGTPSIPPPTVRPHHCSSRPENSRASEPSLTKMAESNHNMDIPSTPADEAGRFPTSSPWKQSLTMQSSTSGNKTVFSESVTSVV